MKITFNQLGVVVSTNFAELPTDSLRQGSVGNVLNVEFQGHVNDNLSATVNFTRPDGTKVSNLLMLIKGDNEFYIVFDDPWYFALSGNATLTIFLRDSQENVLAQGQVQLAIESTDYDEDAVPPIDTEQYTELLSRVNGKVNASGNTAIGSDFALKRDGNNVLSFIDGHFVFATVPLVGNKNVITEQSLGEYDTTIKNWVSNQNYIDETELSNSLLIYATQSWVQQQISALSSVYQTKEAALQVYNSLYNLILEFQNVANGKTKSYIITATQNPAFNSNDDELREISSIILTGGQEIPISSLKIGDVILVTETDVPDRWYRGDGRFQKMETAKVDLTPYETHIQDSDIHVTAADKSNWNTHVGNTDIHVTASDKTAWNGHLANNDIHVTAQDKSRWDSHVANTEVHVTAADKANWNGKSVVSASGTGTSTNPLSYITIDGIEYQITPATQVAVIWGQITGDLINQADLKSALDGKQANLTTVQLSAVNSGITSTKVSSYDTHIADSNIHVTSSEKSTWNAKQNALTFDTAPTANSTNPVTSGGVYNACRTIEETAAGRCKTYVINTQSQITGTKDANDEYTGVTAITGIILTDLKLGDQILIKELSVPDYWVSALVLSGDVLQSVSLSKMETTKVSMEGTDIKSTNQARGKFLQSDGNGNSTWEHIEGDSLKATSEPFGRVLVTNGADGTQWDKIYNDFIDSTGAASGDVLTADGLGGASWETPKKLYLHQVVVQESNNITYLIKFISLKSEQLNYNFGKSDVLSGTFQVNGGTEYPLIYIQRFFISITGNVLVCYIDESDGNNIKIKHLTIATTTGYTITDTVTDA